MENLKISLYNSFLLKSQPTKQKEKKQLFFLISKYEVSYELEQQFSAF